MRSSVRRSTGYVFGQQHQAEREHPQPEQRKDTQKAADDQQHTKSRCDVDPRIRSGNLEQDQKHDVEPEDDEDRRDHMQQRAVHATRGRLTVAACFPGRRTGHPGR